MELLWSQKINFWSVKMKKIIKKILYSNSFVLLILSFLGIILRGYKFGISNHAFYIPMIDKISNPSLFNRDIMFSFDYNNTFFYHIMSFLNNFISLEALFLISYMVFSILFVFAIYKLSFLLFKNKYISYLSVVLLIFIKPSIGGGDATFYSIFVYNIISIPLLLYSIYFFLKKRFIPSYILLGTVFLVHAISAIHLFGLYLLYFLIDIHLRYKHNYIKFLKSRYFKKIVFSIILFVLIISPLILFKFTSDSTGLINADKKWLMIQELRSPHHIFPSHWGYSFVLVFPYVIIGLISILYFYQNKELKPRETVHRDLKIFFIGFSLFMVLGTIFTEIFPIKLIILFQLFRSTNFLMILLIMYSAYFLYSIYTKSANKKIMVVGLFSGLFVSSPFFLLIFIPLALKELKFIRKFETFNISKILNLFFAFGVLIGLFFIITPSLNLFSIPINYKIIPPIALIAFAITTILLYIPHINREINNKKFVLVMILFILFFITSNALLNLDSPEKKLEENEWKDMQNWARLNTEINESIIVPKSGFRIYSKRPIYTDWKDGTLAFFSEKFSYEWYKRISELGNSERRTDWYRNYNNLTEEKIIEIGKRYNQQYVIFGDEKKINLNKVYNNSKYSIYKIGEDFKNGN